MQEVSSSTSEDPLDVSSGDDDADSSFCGGGTLLSVLKNINIFCSAVYDTFLFEQ